MKDEQMARALTPTFQVPNPRRRFHVELITAESEASLLVRHRRLIRFPHGIAVQAGVVFGFDHEDPIFWTTVEFYRWAGLDSGTVSVLIPFPNTPLFKRLDAEGRILTRDWSRYNGKKDVVFQPREKPTLRRSLRYKRGGGNTEARGRLYSVCPATIARLQLG